MYNLSIIVHHWIVNRWIVYRELAQHVLELFFSLFSSISRKLQLI